MKARVNTAEKRDLNDLSGRIIGHAMDVHSKLGPGLLESAYEEVLLYEMQKHGLRVEKQEAIPLVYEEVELECGYRADLFVEGKIILEIKSVEALNDVHLAQVMTYLRLSGCHLGFLMNFNSKLLMDGLRRVVNDF